MCCPPRLAKIFARNTLRKRSVSMCCPCRNDNSGGPDWRLGGREWGCGVGAFDLGIWTLDFGPCVPPPLWAKRTVGANLHPREKHERFHHLVVPQRGLGVRRFITALVCGAAAFSSPSAVYCLPSTVVLISGWLGSAQRIRYQTTVSSREGAKPRRDGTFAPLQLRVITCASA